MKFLNKALVLMLTLVLLLVPFGVSAAASNAPVEVPLFLTQFDKTALDLSPYWGKAYLIFFFTDSSEYAHQQFPDLKRIYESYSSDALQIVMVHEWADETEEHTMNIIEDYGLYDMTFFEDKDMSVSQALKLPRIPMTIFMDAGGYLFDAFAYAVPFETMAEVVDAMGVPKGTPTVSTEGTPEPEVSIAADALATPLPPEADPTPTAAATPTPKATAASTPVPTPTATPGSATSTGAPFGAINVVN